MHHLKFFKDWNSEKKMNQLMYNLNGVDVSKFYVAKESYDNMRQCIYGFLKYIEILFEREPFVYRVYAAHSSQSSIENSFSATRKDNHDRIDLYPLNVLMHNNIIQQHFRTLV